MLLYVWMDVLRCVALLRWIFGSDRCHKRSKDANSSDRAAIIALNYWNVQCYVV
jgi:hypothetical protein